MAAQPLRAGRREVGERGEWGGVGGSERVREMRSGGGQGPLWGNVGGSRTGHTRPLLG